MISNYDHLTHKLVLFVLNHRRFIYKMLSFIDSDLGGEEEEETSTSSSGHGLNGTTLRTNKKPRKARTAFTDQQLNCLEKSFERQKYLSVQDRMELAARLNLSDTQVKTWYQNRR